MKIKFDKVFFFFIVFSWLSLLLSINTKPEEIMYFGEGLLRSINAIRIIIPLIISIILSLYFFSNFELDYLKKLPLIFFFWSSYLLVQIIGFFQEANEYTSYISTLYLIILGISVLKIIYLIKKKMINFKINYLMLLTIITLVFVFSLYFFFYFSTTNIFTTQNRFDLYYLINPDSFFIYQTGPRITGLSRMAAIIAIFFLIVIFYKNLKKHIKILFIILLTILSFLIWYMQSRGTILCYYSIILFIIFLARKVNFRKKIFFFFLIIIFPISSNYVYFKINQKFVENKIVAVENKIVANENKLNPRIIENKTTSGRLILWSEILKNYDFQKIFGYGPQADRLLLKGETNELGNTYGNNASNGFVYAFACGGYLGLLFYILINIQILIFIYKSVLINKIFSKNNLIYVKLSITYLLFFFIRQLFENSFSLFGIDYLIVVISSFIVEGFLKKNHK